MKRARPIFYSALMLTAVNLLLRFVATSFQVYISGRIGASGVGLLQLVMSVGMLANTASMAGIRTTAMYLTAEQLGRKKPGTVIWVLSGCILYSVLCSAAVSSGLYYFAPFIAEKWIGDDRTIGAIRLFAGFLPITCLCGVMTGYYTAANRIGTLAAVEVGEQLIYMLVTMLALNFWAGNNAQLACQAVVAGSGISMCLTLITLVILRIKEAPDPSRKIPTGKRLLGAAVPLALADDLKSGISTAENLMVPKRLALYPGTADPLASFGMLSGMVFPILMFPAAILFGLAELLIPELARCAAAGSRDRIRYLVRRSLKVAMLYGCLFGGLMYLTADALCLAVYHNDQVGSLLRRFSFLAPMLYCDAITDAMTKGLGQQRACVRYNILTSAMDVILLFLLLPKYGIDGYYFSFVATHLLNFILSIRRLLRITGPVVDWKKVLLTLPAVAGAIWAASHLYQPIPQCIAFFLLGSSLLFLGGVLEKEDIRWARGLITG